MKTFVLLPLLAALALGACDDDDDPTGTGGTAQVRVVNATTGTTYATINALNGSASIGAGIGQGSAASCTAGFTVPAGSRTINFRTTGSTTNVAPITYSFQANKKYTIVFYGTNTSPRSIVIEDEATQTNATAGNRRLRFVNVSTNATNADIFARVSTETAPPTGAATVVNVATGTVGTAGGSMYVLVPEASNGFRIYNTGTTATPRYAAYTLVTANYPASGNATLLFTDTGVIQLNNCS